MFKRTIYSLKLISSFDKNQDFLNFREHNLRQVALLLIKISVPALMLYHILDEQLGFKNIEYLFFIRLIEIALLLINIPIINRYKNKKKLKIHIILGFYQVSLFSTYIGYLTGGLNSFYWIGLMFIVLMWFTFIPIEFKKLCIHGAIFITQYTAILIIAHGKEINLHQIDFHLFLLCVFFISMAAAYVNHRSAVSMYGFKKNAEKAELGLKESEEKYRTLVERANDGVVIIQDGYVRFINEMMAFILGFDRKEMLNTPFMDYIAPFQRERIFDLYSRRQKGDEIPHIYEAALITKDGIVKEVEFNTGLITYNNKTATLVYIRDIEERKKAEQALRESEARFSAFMNNFPAAAFIFDEYGRYVYANNQFRRQMGNTELIGRTYNEVQAENPNIKHQILNYKSYDEKNFYISEDLFTNSDGSQLTITSFCFPINVESQGKLMGVIALDISDNKKAEHLLRDSELKYKSIFETAGDAIFLVDIQTIKILDANISATELYGYSKDEFLNLTIVDLFADKNDVVEDYEVTMSSFAFPEQKHVRKDGAIIFVSVTGSSFTQNDSTLAIAIIHDITQRKNDEEALRKSNERLTLHIHQTPLAYIECDDKLDILEWNPSAENIFGYSKKEALGNHALKLIVSDDNILQFENIFSNLFNKTGGTRSNTRNITKDGRTIYCEWYNTALKDKYGRIIGLASLVQDITERKRLEAQLEKEIFSLEKDYSQTVAQMQTYFSELQVNKNELLRLQKENLQSQFDTLKNQVNPHFLFNSLNVLSSLIQYDPQTAERFTEQMAKVYRYVLEHKSEDLVTLTTEIDFVESYTFLLNIRFKDKVVFKIDVPQNLLDTMIPPMTLQILIENCIKHNTFSRKSPLNVRIYVDENEFIRVENNLQQRPAKIESTGLGLTNIRNRYKFFSNKEPEFGITENLFIAKIPLL